MPHRKPHAARPHRPRVATIQAGDRVVLADGEDRRLVVAGGEPARVPGLGVLDARNLVGLAYGATYRHGTRNWRALRPGYADLAATVERKAQIVLPKDAARILWECDVRAGSLVVESGAGSGALTLALARAASPGGRVVVYEIREDFLAHARGNLERAGFSDAVEFRLGDVTRGIDVEEADAVVLDLPAPWDAVPAAAKALRADGHLAAYSPLVSQVEQTVAALRASGFADIRVLEVIERTWHVGERGARPEHEMLGHTGFLTFARRA